MTIFFIINLFSAVLSRGVCTKKRVFDGFVKTCLLHLPRKKVKPSISWCKMAAPCAFSGPCAEQQHDNGKSNSRSPFVLPNAGCETAVCSTQAVKSAKVADDERTGRSTDMVFVVTGAGDGDEAADRSR